MYIMYIRYIYRLYEMYKCAYRNTSNVYTLRTNLSTYNGILKRSIRHAKSIYFAKLFEKYQNNIKKNWNTINSILNRFTDNKINTKGFKDVKKIITERVEIANIFYYFFTKKVNNKQIVI